MIFQPKLGTILSAFIPILNVYNKFYKEQNMRTENDGRNDFDFLVGNWIMRHRRLKERLKECSEWEEFEGTAVGKKLLNGLGHCDEVIMNREMGPTHGFTLRLFDLQSKEWSIYSAASPGRRSQQTLLSGNRRFPSMAARL